MACCTEDFLEDVVCQVGDVGENELKTFKFKHGEVLLIKQNNNIKAFGPTCTHYGGPLVNGVVASNRIRCPLHGSCFSLCNGDIEDFPGLDSLPSYEVNIVGQNVKVKAKTTGLCTNKRVKPMCKKNPSSEESIVLIGGGPASAICAETLRQEKFSGDITMICRENVLPYDRVRCSKEIDFNIKDATFRNDDFYKTHNINVLKGISAKKVDTSNKNVTLENGTVLNYTKLFVAVGFDPIRPDIPGMNLKNIFVINRYEHSHSVKSQILKETQVAIKGCGFVGLEVAEYCVGKVKKITVLMESDHTLLTNVFGAEIGDAIVNRMKNLGVEFIPNVNVKQFNGTNKVENVEACDGTKYPADLVIVDVGWAANTDFLKSSGLKVEDDGTIEANIYLESNVEDVYVGGDIAKAPVYCNNNHKDCIGHIAVAMHHGKIAGMNLAGKKTQLKVIVYYWTILGGVNLRVSGHGPFDDIVYTGSVVDMKFIAYYLNKDIVTIMCSCNMDPYVAIFAEMTNQGKKLNRSDVSDCADPLSWANCKL